MIPKELVVEAGNSFRAETLRAQGYRREERDGVNRASWRLTIKGQGTTDVMQSSSTHWISFSNELWKPSQSLPKGALLFGRLFQAAPCFRESSCGHSTLQEVHT